MRRFSLVQYPFFVYGTLSFLRTLCVAKNVSQIIYETLFFAETPVTQQSAKKVKLDHSTNNSKGWSSCGKAKNLTWLGLFLTFKFMHFTFISKLTFVLYVIGIRDARYYRPIFVFKYRFKK